MAALFRMYLSGSYRKPDNKNKSAKPIANTAATSRLLTLRRYTVGDALTIETSMQARCRSAPGSVNALTRGPVPRCRR